MNFRTAKNSSLYGRVGDALESASDTAHTTGSGTNFDNATRQKLRALKSQPGWTPDEQTAIQSVIDGTAQATPRAGSGAR